MANGLGLTLCPLSRYTLWVDRARVHVSKSLQSCLTLCNPLDCSPPGPSVYGIFQARMGCHALLQAIFSTQCRIFSCTGGQILSLPLALPGKPPEQCPKYSKFEINQGWTFTVMNTRVCGCSDGTESVCNVGYLGLIPGMEKSPGGGHGNPLQFSCLENLHGQRSLAGYSPWDCKESDTTEWLSTELLQLWVPGFVANTLHKFTFPLQMGLDPRLPWKVLI